MSDGDDDATQRAKALVPGNIQAAILAHGNAAFDCGAWGVEDEGQVRYRDLADRATASRLALEQAIEQALTEARQAALDEAAGIAEGFSPTYMVGMERWLKASESSDGQPHRMLDLAPHLERQRVAQLILQGERDENLCERIAQLIRQAGVKKYLTSDHLVDANKMVDEEETRL